MLQTGIKYTLLQAEIMLLEEAHLILHPEPAYPLSSVTEVYTWERAF